VQKLDADMAANKESQAKAELVREGELGEYLTFKADSEDAIKQMSEAIDVLAGIGADQTMEDNAAADHTRFMKGATADEPTKASLTKLRSTVKQALVAASAFTTKKQVHLVESFIQNPDSFLQKPFTGTYTAQSGEVVGILKDMRDTFDANLASATQEEEAAAEAHKKYIANMQKAYEEMQTSYESKQDTLSANDATLGEKKEQLVSAKDLKASDEEFLASLLDMCAKKAADYNERNLLRKNEQAALAQAISILNSDQAFETFGKVSATSTGATILLTNPLARERP